MIYLEDLVPKNHIILAINVTIDFNLIYDEVEGMYSIAENECHGIDSVSLFYKFCLYYKINYVII